MGGERSYSIPYVYSREQVQAHGNFVCQTTNSALPAANIHSRAVSGVVASGGTAGSVYTITFAEKFPALLSFRAQLCSATARNYWAQPDVTYTVNAGEGNGSTLVVRIVNASGAAQPATSDTVCFVAVFDNQVFS